MHFTHCKALFLQGIISSWKDISNILSLSGRKNSGLVVFNVKLYEKQQLFISIIYAYPQQIGMKQVEKECQE